MHCSPPSHFLLFRNLIIAFLSLTPLSLCPQLLPPIPSPPLSSKMSAAVQHYTTNRVYESDSYMWSSKDQLGSGAGGTVYVGYHKVGLGGRGRRCVGQGMNVFPSLPGAVRVMARRWLWRSFGKPTTLPSMSRRLRCWSQSRLTRILCGCLQQRRRCDICYVCMCVHAWVHVYVWLSVYVCIHPYQYCVSGGIHIWRLLKAVKMP